MKMIKTALILVSEQMTPPTLLPYLPPYRQPFGCSLATNPVHGSELNITATEIAKKLTY